MQGVGNINYSLNKNDFYKILLKNTFLFIPFYFILVILSISFLFNIKYSLLYHITALDKYIKNADLEHYFKSITFNSPFNIMSIDYGAVNNQKFIGLSNKSYILFIISYVIVFILILDGLIRNLIYSVYSNVIQVNPHNNPYNNNDCISKISVNPNVSISKNYFTIISLGFLFLIPFAIPYLIKLFNFDNYDIKHKKWFAYLILFLIFAPFIITLLCRTYFRNKLSVFSDLNQFIEPKDNDFIQFIIDNFKFNMTKIMPYLLIVLIYFYYKFVYSEKKTMKEQIKFYAIFIFIIFIIIPIFLIFLALSLIFTNKNINKNENNISGIESAQYTVDDINKNGISNLYQLLVKYNYPCFYK